MQKLGADGIAQLIRMSLGVSDEGER